MAEQRRMEITEELSKFNPIFNHFQFEDGSLLTDEDILFIKQIGFPETTSVRYKDNRLTEESVKILCQAYPNASEIELSNNPIKNESVKYIAKLVELLQLKLRNTELSAAGMKLFAGVEMKCLMEVHLNQNMIGSKGCQWLTAANWPYLQSIYLTKCNINDAGALHLSKSNWKDLSLLYLMDNFFTLSGVSYLKKASWPQLKTLSINNDSFSWCFRMIHFYPHAFKPECNFSFRRMKRLNRMYMVSSRFNGPMTYNL